MSIEKDLQKDGIIVAERIDAETVINITNSISKKIVETFPNFNLDESEIFGKLFNLNMYKADMPEGTLEASYCYKNSSIYFNSQVADEDLEEFAIHECLHYLQEVRNEHNKVIKMGLADYSGFKTVGIGINEAAVQYIAAKIIGIKPDFEKYFNLDLFTPSPSYYPVECALLYELIFFVGESVLFKSTYFSTDDFKDEIIRRSSKNTYKKIVKAFDDILKYEEQIIALNNQYLNTDKNENLQENIEKYRVDINNTFIQTQNLIIKEFFDKKFENIQNLEQLENCRRKLDKFKLIIGKTDNDTFFDDYYLEFMNKLEHKANVLENGGLETAVSTKSFSIFDIFNKIKDLLISKKSYEK